MTLRNFDFKTWFINFLQTYRAEFYNGRILYLVGNGNADTAIYAGNTGYIYGGWTGFESVFKAIHVSIIHMYSLLSAYWFRWAGGRFSELP